jgi:hypothetical protein
MAALWSILCKFTRGLLLVLLASILLILPLASPVEAESHRIANTDETIYPNSSELPSGKIAFVSDRDDSNDLFIMNADGSDLASVGVIRADNPAFSPDGKTIAYGSGSDIFTININGSNNKQVTNLRGGERPSWSPDGKKIVYEGLDDYFMEPEIFVINADGTQDTQLTKNSATDTYPSWSPDGENILFTSNRDGYFALYTMKADGTKLTKITNASVDPCCSAWSPDGTRIVFDNFAGNRPQIFVMNTDGSNIQQLTNNSYGCDDPIWSPDGSQIAFTASYPLEHKIYTEICIMHSDGSGQTRLTNREGRDYQPTWSMDVSAMPALMTLNATDVNSSSARLHGFLYSTGMVTDVKVSFVWGTSPGQYDHETFYTIMNSSGPFGSMLISLKNHQTYYFKAKAVGNETVFGKEISFYAAQRYTLTLAVNGNGFLIPEAGDYIYPDGTSVEITAVPDYSWKFTNWSGMVSNTGSAKTIVSLDDNRKITANFTKDTIGIIFPDTSLDAVIRKALDKLSIPIYAQDLQYLTSIDAHSLGIRNLSGLQYCTNLVELNLRDNQISDISPLSSLTKLQILEMHRNQIQELFPVNTLKELTALELSDNMISDISPLASLVNLKELFIEDNLVRDLSSLSAISGLHILNLSNNLIDNISPLVENSGFGTGDHLDISLNLLDLNPSSTATMDIQTLTDRGVDVIYNSQSDPCILTLSANGKGSLSPSAGVYIYNPHKEVQVTAAPDTGWEFDHWSGSVTGKTNPLTLSITGNMEITANFIQTYCSLSVNFSGSGTVKISNSLPLYKKGTPVNLKAQPSAGWKFVNWTGDVAKPASAATKIIMDSDKTVTANFARMSYSLTLKVSGSGSLMPEPGTHSFIGDTVVALTAIPAQGYMFVKWSGEVADANSASTTVTLNKSKSVTAVFKKIIYYTLSVSVTGNGTTDQSGSQKLLPGSTVQISAAPAAGWKFSKWSGNASGSANPLSVRLSRNLNIKANFIPDGITSIKDILDNPMLYKGYSVTLSGLYQGQQTGWPVSKKDWVLQDDSGSIWVNGGSVSQDTGTAIKISGKVQNKNGKPYIKFTRILQ